jgi:hypothetical protein
MKYSQIQVFLHSITAKTLHFLLCAGCDRPWLQPLSRVRDKRLAMQPKENIMDFATKELTHGQTNALVKNLMDQMCVSDPVEAIRRINAGEWVVIRKPPTFSIWMTTRVGNLGYQGQARNKLGYEGIKVTPPADSLITRTTFAPVETSFDLVLVTLKDLGLKDGATTVEVYTTAQEGYGLSLCPAEAALQLWLQHSFLPHLRFSLVGMEPIEVDRGDPKVFTLQQTDDGRWLNTCNAHPDTKWRSYSHWIFVR